MISPVSNVPTVSTAQPAARPQAATAPQPPADTVKISPQAAAKASDPDHDGH